MSEPTEDLEFTVASDTLAFVSAPDEYSDHWVIQGDFRVPGSGWSCEANYDICDNIRVNHPGIDFGPESSCFFAYADTKEEALALVEGIKTWMVGKGRG